MEVFEKVFQDAIKGDSKILVKDLYFAGAMSKSKYYREYGSFSEFVQAYLEDQIDRYFKFDSKIEVKVATFKLLKVIKEKKDILQILYDQTTREEHNQIKEQLVYKFKDIILLYSSVKYGISESYLNRVAEGIYNQIHSWILHDCKDEIEKILDLISGYIAQIEGHRCSYYRRFGK